MAIKYLTSIFLPVYWSVVNIWSSLEHPFFLIRTHLCLASQQKLVIVLQQPDTFSQCCILCSASLKSKSVRASVIPPLHFLDLNHFWRSMLLQKFHKNMHSYFYELSQKIYEVLKCNKNILTIFCHVSCFKFEHKGFRNTVILAPSI